MLELLSNKRSFIVQKISFVEKRLNNKRYKTNLIQNIDKIFIFLSNKKFSFR